MFSRIRDVLTTMRSVRDTAGKATTVREIVMDFVADSVQLGTGIDEIEDKLHLLHRKELLISEDVLKDASAFAQKEHSKHKELQGVQPPPRSKSLPKEPLFSKDTIYHADLCCRVLAEGDAGNYQSLFKKLPNGQGHSFKAVSMSRSKTARLLIAEQGDSLIYFAFEGRPQLLDWKGYKSFDEGVFYLY